MKLILKLDSDQIPTEAERKDILGARCAGKIKKSMVVVGCGGGGLELVQPPG